MRTSTAVLCALALAGCYTDSLRYSTPVGSLPTPTVAPPPACGPNVGVDFGDGQINNADVVSIFQLSLTCGSGSPGDPLPPHCPVPGTHLFDAMDSMPPDVPPLCGGDGRIVNSDVSKTFMRSLLPDEPRFKRRRWPDGRCESVRCS